jgi:MinD-like ATPase involved in chromosome partitioning or flagellar assembly
MVVVILILLSLGVAGFIMVSDARKNDSFKRLEKQAGDAVVVDTGSDGGGDGDGGGGGD